MTRPIALRSEAGVVYTYACGACHNVSGGTSAGGQDEGPRADIVAGYLAHATRCCSCRVCGAEDPDRTRWGYVCPGCKPGEDQREEERRARNARQAEIDAAHRAASLKLAIDVDAAERLFALMSDISEARWFASWLSGNEFAVWRELQGGTKETDWTGYEADFAELKRLHEKCGGWWYWHSEHGETFVPTAAWLEIYAQHMRPREAVIGG